MESWRRRSGAGTHLGRVAAKLGVAVVIGVGAAACGGGGGSTAGTGATGTPITLAMITSLTGPGSSEFSQAAAGFNARVALQNAEGGIHGHKISGVVIDDQTSPTEVVTAVQDALSKGAFGIVSTSPLFFLAAKYPNQQGVPVTGGFFDGPEWGEAPYTNMFASDFGSVDPKYPVNTSIGTFMKKHGGTVVCSYGYGISPSSTRSAAGTADSFKLAGGKVGVLDTSIPFGSVAMTTVALVAKGKGCNAFYAGLDDNSNFALATALKQAGVKPKVVVFPTGYEPSLVDSTSWSAVQGGYFSTEFRPFQLPNAGTRQMQAAPGEVRALHQQAVPLIQPVRIVARSGPHDQGSVIGRNESDPSGSDPCSAQPEGLQRERPPAPADRLFDDLRTRPAPPVQLVHAGRPERVRGHLEHADMRYRRTRDDHGTVLTCPRLRRPPGLPGSAPPDPIWPPWPGCGGANS